MTGFSCRDWWFMQIEADVRHNTSKQAPTNVRLRDDPNELETTHADGLVMVWKINEDDGSAEVRLG